VSGPLQVVRGRAPIVLVAPHGGRRDAERRPWGGAALKMNDLHTAALAEDLAARLDASALINASTDRNDVDLNRVTAAHDGAPAFLDALAELVADALSRHPRVTVLTVHGWNVVQPAVDIGLGAQPGAEALAGGGPCAVAPEFATTVLPRFAAALDARGIAATPGLRYPARARENLLQLFTPRYRADERAAVRRLADVADRVDALQLELSLPLRLPGPWRDAFIEASAAAFGGATTDAAVWPPWLDDVPPPDAVALEFVAPGLAGLAAIDPHGGRLLLFPDDGRLAHFTGERVGRHGADRVGPLRVTADEAGTIAVDFDGPMLSFPDTMPFVDLERGLATASAVAVRARLRFWPSHATADDACPYGAVRGHVQIGDVTHDVAGHGIRSRREVALAPRRRAGLRLADGTIVVVRGDEGVVCRNGEHRAVRSCALRHDARTARLEVETDGASVTADLRIVHRLPVVPGVAGAEPILFVACAHGDRPAGWLTVRATGGH